MDFGSIGRVLQRQLVLNDEILAKLQRRFKARGIDMPANNARQALVLAGSDVLENNHGTAPGLWVNAEKNHVILLPGPPGELKPMFEQSCMPRLREMAGGVAMARCVFRTACLAESLTRPSCASSRKEGPRNRDTSAHAPYV